MVWANEIESARSTADLVTSHTTTRAKLLTNFQVLDSKIGSGLWEIFNGDFTRRVFIQEEAAQRETRFLTEGKSHG